MKKNKNGFIQHYCDGAGFTLIELLVAMTIMAVLMGISLVSYQGAKKAARDGKRKADLEQIRSALEIYRTDCKTYPATGSVVWGQPLAGAGVCVNNTYMEKVPADPGSNSYYYNKGSGSNSYTLCASLETGTAVAESGCGSCVGICNYKVINP